MNERHTQAEGARHAEHPQSSTRLVDADAAAMQASRALAYLDAEVVDIEKQLQAAPNWRPAATLLAEVAWCRDKLTQLRASWGQKLVVALVGPSGAGKSTLLNALVGQELSPASLTRPTTRQVVVYAHSLADAEDLVRHCGSENVRVETEREAAALEYLILVDTPDTNTLPENQRLLTRVLERADLLLAVFPAQNPKLYDNIAFLRPYVHQLPQGAVVPVLNFIDRVPPDEMEGTVADFSQAIAHEWSFEPERLYRVSAKAALPGATFAEDEQPLNAVNEIDALRSLLFASLNRASQVADRRLARAERLLDVVREECQQQLRGTQDAREELPAQLNSLAERAREDLLFALTAPGSPLARQGVTGLGNHAAFYGLVSPRWWGPVGWLIALWALGLRLVSWLGNLFRPPKPLLGLRPEPAKEVEAGSSQASEAALWETALTRLYAQSWPTLTPTLSAAGFDATVRQTPFWQEWVRRAGVLLQQRWATVRQDRLEGLANTLSGWLLQLLLNAPALAMLGWAGVQTVMSFIQQRYLPVDYFRHAGIAALVLWLLGFVLFQIVASLALRAPLRRQMARALHATFADVGNPLQDQLAALAVLDAQTQR